MSSDNNFYSFPNTNNNNNNNNNDDDDVNGYNKSTEEYVRPKKTQQDIISENSELLKEKLKGYTLIYPQHYNELCCGVWVRYITEENKYRSGGVLKHNGAPDYFILKCPYSKKSWSVSLSNKNVTIYIKGSENSFNKMVEKNNLYKLYEAGLVQISEKATPEEIKAILGS